MLFLIKLQIDLGDDTMSKKIKPESAERIYNEFMKNVCVKARKVSKEGCRYDEECLMGKCICKYILKNYDVREKQEESYG